MSVNERSTAGDVIFNPSIKLSVEKYIHFKKMLSFFNFLYIFISAVWGEKNLLQFIRAFDAPMSIRIEIERYYKIC
jgi:hypothetical protein